MAGRRKKRRTHVKGSAGGEAEGKKFLPKSFVVRIGPAEKTITQLVRDFRRVMEPLTASRLKERKGNKLKDYQAVAGPLGVTHFCLFAQSEEQNVNLRVGVFPNGPTLYYRVQGYCLMRDVSAGQRRPHSPGLECQTSPLVVLGGFDVQKEETDKLQCTILQNAFPALVPSQTKLEDVRRVVLFNKTAEGKVQMRHYLITVKEEHGDMAGRLEKKLKKAKDLDLSGYVDIADYFMQAADSSESEADASVLVKSNNTEKNKDKEKNNEEGETKKKIRLVEVGPRLDLELIKISEGLNGGKVLFHI